VVQVGRLKMRYGLDRDSDSDDDISLVRSTTKRAPPPAATTTTTAAASATTSAPLLSPDSPDEYDVSRFLPSKKRALPGTGQPTAPPARRVKTESQQRNEDALWDDEDMPPASGARAGGGGSGKASNKGKSIGGRPKRDKEEERGAGGAFQVRAEERGGSAVGGKELRCSPNPQRAQNLAARNSGQLLDDDGAPLLIPDFGDSYTFGPVGPFEPYKLGAHSVPASLNRYLKDYQRAGIQFLYERVHADVICLNLRLFLTHACTRSSRYDRIASNKGAILGDDMGLGKTIQIIALFTALFEKKGDSTDLSKITEQGRQAERFAEKEQLAQRNKYLDESKSAASSSQSTQDLPPPPLHKYAPVLLVVPASVVDNWMVELNKWGHFSAFK
jgi:hypothetical protein